MVCHVQSATSVRPRSNLPAKPPVELTVDRAIDLFLDCLCHRGASERTLIGRSTELRRFFGPVLNQPLRTLSPERMQELSNDLQDLPSRKTGEFLLKKTALAYHATARRFIRWCMAQGRLPADSMAGLKKKTTLQLHEEVNKLRADIEAMRRQRDQAWQQLNEAAVGAP